MSSPKKSQEHPLANILINVLIPVLSLSFLSKDPMFQEVAKPWHLGPVKALIVALAFPIGYGLWHFAKTRKMNFFSGLGLASVLLTGGLTIFLWNKDGSIKEHADVLFGLKEASIPFVLGICILWSRRTESPLLNLFLYNDSIFDIPKIEKKVAENDASVGYEHALAKATRLFAASFFVSTVLNFCLSMYFLGGLDAEAANAREVYNAQVAKITGWGFLVIGLPVIVFLFFTLRTLLKDLRAITGYEDEELMLPR